jgi:hypothetical protein
MIYIMLNRNPSGFLVVLTATIAARKKIEFPAPRGVGC